MFSSCRERHIRESGSLFPLVSPWENLQSLNLLQIAWTRFLQSKIAKIADEAAEAKENNSL